MANKGSQILTQLLFNIEANTAQLRTGLDQAKSQISNFSSTVTKLGGAIGVAFGVREIGQFILSAAKLAGEFQGVKTAFDKIGGSIKLLEDLKQATNGTVSELNLMKRAVAFQNFGLDLQQLPKLLEFATKRAQQTGQSVDYLVDSIVTGLGRKSVLILDNLGISSSQLNAEIEKTGDFFGAVGTIVDRSLEDMGDLVETNVTKTERLNAAWENFKVRIGEVANETGILGTALDAASESLNVASSKNLSFWEKISAFMSVGGMANAQVKEAIATFKAVTEEGKKQDQVIREVNRAYKEFNGNIDAYAKTISTHVLKTQLLAEFTKRLTAEEEKRKKGIENIANLEERLNALKEKMRFEVGKDLANTKKEIMVLEDKLKVLKEMERTLPKTIAFNTEKKTGSQFLSDVGVAPEVSGEIPGLAEQNAQVITLMDNWTRYGEVVKQNIGGIAVSAIDKLGTAIADMVNGSKGAFKGLVSAILDMIQDIIMGMLAQSIAAIIAGEARERGIYALITAGIAVAAFKSFWNKNIPEFANGGVAPGGLSLVGERGAELVNLPSGSRVHTNAETKRMLGGMNSGMNVNLSGVLRGEDIYLSYNEVDRKRNNSI